jgi:hypothetical protein
MPKKTQLREDGYMSCTDWRIYEDLTKADWRPGDEPEIAEAVIVTYGKRRIVVPLPRDAVVERFSAVG